jgi:hypothetical protein
MVNHATFASQLSANIVRFLRSLLGSPTPECRSAQPRSRRNYRPSTAELENRGFTRGFSYARQVVWIGQS